jgi:hypothetical protein
MWLEVRRGFVMLSWAKHRIDGEHHQSESEPWRSFVNATEAGLRKGPDRDLVLPWPPSSWKKMRAW